MSAGLRMRLLKLGAWALLVLGRHTRAAGMFDRMLVLDPTDAQALASRAHLKARAGDRLGAIDDYHELVRLHPNRASGWFNLGYLLEQGRQWSAAAQCFVRATQVDPSLDRAWYGLGLVLIRLERYDDAVKALKRNTELQPLSPYGWYQLARVHIDRHQPDEAAKIIRHLRGFEPKVAAQLEKETGLPGLPAGS